MALMGTTQAPLARSDEVVRVPRVLVIGDSISLGEGAGQVGPDCPLTPETSRPGETYAAIVARAAGGELASLAISGRGLVRNYDDFPSLTMQQWLGENDFGRLPVADLAPDLILINLGTNDFHDNDPEPAFSAAYGNLLQTLRSRNPESLVYRLFGPMLDGAEALRADSAVRSAIKAQAAKGDSRVHYVRLPTDPHDPEMIGCNWHPSLKAHEAMAQRLLVRILLDTLE